MRIATFTLALFLLTTIPAVAGPLPCSYTMRFAPSGNAETILLGTDTRYGYDHVTGIETATPVWVVHQDSERFASGQAYFGTTDLFSFHHGMWDLAESPPSNAIANRFVLEYDFSDGGPHGESGGDISAMGVFTSGTGNFSLGFTNHPELYLNEMNARVEFGLRESESHSTITMTITTAPEPVPTPEPGTLILGGIGIAGLCGLRLRRRIAM